MSDVGFRPIPAVWSLVVRPHPAPPLIEEVALPWDVSRGLVWLQSAFPPHARLDGRGVQPAVPTVQPAVPICPAYTRQAAWSDLMNVVSFLPAIGLAKSCSRILSLHLFNVWLFNGESSLVTY